MSLPYGLANLDVILVTVRGIYQQQTILNTYHYQYQGQPVSDAQPDFDALHTALNEFGTNETVAFQISLSNGLYACQDVKYQLVWPKRYQAYTRSNIKSGGRPSTTPMPSNSAAVVSRYTRVAGRGKVGSVHIGGLAWEDTGGGQMMTADWLSQARLFADAMILPIPALSASSKWVPGLLKTGDPTSFEALTQATARNRPRVMRRRTIGVGI